MIGAEAQLPWVGGDRAAAMLRAGTASEPRVGFCRGRAVSRGRDLDRAARLPQVPFLPSRVAVLLRGGGCRREHPVRCSRDVPAASGSAPVQPADVRRGSASHIPLSAFEAPFSHQ